MSVCICSHMGGIDVEKTRLASKCVEYLFHLVFDEVLARCISFFSPSAKCYMHSIQDYSEEFVQFLHL